MTTALIVAFLIAHGLVHLAIWLPTPDSRESVPFVPSHSAVLTHAQVTEETTRTASLALAATTTGAFVLAGLGVAVSAPWTAYAAVVASLLGLTLKVLYFHPWLSIGVVLDVLVLWSALWAWLIPLT